MMVTFWEKVSEWILNNYPVLGLVLFVAWVVWLLAKFLFKMKARFEKAEDKINTLPCASHQEAIDSHSSMKATLDSINEQVTEISKWIMHLDGDMIDILSQKCSPRRMTQLGRNLYDVSGARDAVDENIGFLLGEIEKKNPATPYDVENTALEVLLGNLSHPMFNAVKDYIYYQPEEVELVDENGEKQKVRISLNIIVKLMSLEVRDRYLAAHTENTSASTTK